MTRNAFAFACALGLTLPAPGEENWPGWRGPDDTGHVPTGSYPVKFDDKDGVLWKVELPGLGCSTPVVWQDRVIVTAADSGRNAVVAYDWDSGEELWRTRLGEQRQGKHRFGSGSNPSPVTDGESVFVYFKSGELAALDMNGEVLWSANLQQRYGKDTLYWDLGTSPVLTGRDVVVAVMHDGPSFVAAFDKKTGEVRWKQDRQFQTPRENDHSYASPVVLEQDGKEVILVWGAEHVTAHAAEDGKVLWTCGGFNPQRKDLWPAVASPVVVDGVAVVPYGRGSELTGVKLGGSGDVTESHRLWTSETGSFIPTPAAADGRVILLRNNGEVHAIEPKTGKTAWEGRLPPGRRAAEYYASPVVADGKIYAVRLDGVAFVAELKDGVKLLSENDMGEQIIASPVLLRGRILIRGENHLFCIGDE